MATFSRTYVAGHRGLVGSAVVRALQTAGLPAPIVRTRAELDLQDHAGVEALFARERPQAVVLAAARVGGIQANNTARWDFIYENLVVQNNVLGAALKHGTERVVFLGSSCIYPREAPQPMKEEHLLTGPLEPTNEPYAIAKIAGVKMVESANRQYGKRWVSVMPTNLYGPGDNFDAEKSHVLPALIRKFHDAKLTAERGEDPKVTLWGDGSPRREFLYVDDLARAIVLLMGNTFDGLINVGYGSDVTIRELAETVAKVVGYDGPIAWDRSRPNGTRQKLLDSSRILSLGWRPTVSLEEGVRRTYDWYVAGLGGAQAVRGMPSSASARHKPVATG